MAYTLRRGGSNGMLQIADGERVVALVLPEGVGRWKLTDTRANQIGERDFISPIRALSFFQETTEQETA